MVVNRYSLAHAVPHRLPPLPFVVQPWMVWILAMLLYNIGATAIASIAQLYMPLSLFACLFVTLIVVNLFLAKYLLGESVTRPKVAGAALILVGAGMAGAATPIDSENLQDKYPCRDGQPCVHEHIAHLCEEPAAIALYISLIVITVMSVIAITLMECTYPAADIKRAAAASSLAARSAAVTPDSSATTTRNPMSPMASVPSVVSLSSAPPSPPSSPPADGGVVGKAAGVEAAAAEGDEKGCISWNRMGPRATAPAGIGPGIRGVSTTSAGTEPGGGRAQPSPRWISIAARCIKGCISFTCCVDGTPPDQPPRLAPRWLENLMGFIYPFSFGVDEGIAHLFMRSEVAMNAQCADGGCENMTCARQHLNHNFRVAEALPSHRPLYLESNGV